jgi:hypothetical protein
MQSQSIARAITESARALALWAVVLVSMGLVLYALYALSRGNTTGALLGLPILAVIVLWYRQHKREDRPLVDHLYAPTAEDQARARAAHMAWKAAHPAGARTVNVVGKGLGLLMFVGIPLALLVIYVLPFVSR